MILFPAVPSESVNACFFDWVGVGANMFSQIQAASTNRLQNFRDRLEDLFHFWFRFQVKPDWMTGAAVGFVNCKVIWKLAGVILLVLFRAAGAVLLIHPRDHANGAFRF